MGRPAKHPPEFQRAAVELVLGSGHSSNEVALVSGSSAARNRSRDPALARTARVADCRAPSPWARGAPNVSIHNLRTVRYPRPVIAGRRVIERRLADARYVLPRGHTDPLPCGGSCALSLTDFAGVEAWVSAVLRAAGLQFAFTGRGPGVPVTP